MSKSIVALTGGIACGKSTCANVLEKSGALIVEADSLVHEIFRDEAETRNKIAHEFGEEVITAGGEIDRKALGKIVFSNVKKRLSLEAIVHPRVREVFLNKVKTFNQSKTSNSLLIYVVPLYFESTDSNFKFDSVVVLSSARSICLQRVMHRDRCTEELANKKISAQLPLVFKELHADTILYNDGSEEELLNTSKELYKRLLNLPH